ncbi:MAG: SipW-dependent-type signal peptide-containing protein, partial [Clostridium sp.]|nr:SipW-dependent-type signal peptide-containing protein [Clostridium sp.]
MKKKLLAIGLAVAVLAVTIVGMSIAYFTATDQETNTFTVGNVQIDLIEEFDSNNAVLRPGSQTTNAINKDVWIENTGSENAYVWYEWYIPSELDSTDGSTGTNNVVHVNSLGRTWDNYRTDPRFWVEGQT